MPKQDQDHDELARAIAGQLKDFADDPDELGRDEFQFHGAVPGQQPTEFVIIARAWGEERPRKFKVTVAGE